MIEIGRKRHKDIKFVQGDALNLPFEENVFDDFFLREEKIIFCGNGAEKCQPILTSSFAKFSPIICSAKHLSFLAKKYFDENKFSDVAYFSPLYYKSPNITIPRKVL